MKVENPEPVQADYIEQMKAVLSAVDEFINPDKKNKRIGITLLMFPFGNEDSGRINYMSTAERKDMILSMKLLIAKWEGRYAEPLKNEQI
jgi:hypothetical protein